MYNPFINGEFPVGVRTIELTGKNGNYTTEIWYPAADEYRGAKAIDAFRFVEELPEATQEAVRDARPAQGKRPLVMYWHGGYGHRREMAAMCVYLASHGFVVAAPDFPGDNIRDMYGMNPAIKRRPVDASARARPVQGAEVIELLASNDSSFLRNVVNAEEVGSFGLSLGGFTALSVNAESPRMVACVAIAPSSGRRSPLPQMARVSRLMRLDWQSEVSTLLLTGEADALVILEDVRELFANLAEPKRLVVLKRAGHLHWADNAEEMHETLRLRYLSGEFPDPEIDGPAVGRAFRPFAELCPAEHATETMRGLTLAHFEASLMASAEAKAFLQDGLVETFTARGIDLEVANEPMVAKLE